MALRELLATFGIEVQGEQKLGTLDQRIEGLTSKIKTFGAALAGGAIANAAKNFVIEQVAMGDELVDTAARLGVTTDELQRFQFAAGQFSVGAEGAATALQFLNKNVALAAEGNATVADAFRQLGTHTKNAQGGIRPISELLPDLADGFAALPNDAVRTARAMEIFGRSGAALLPMLKGGRAGAEELSKEFDRLGGGLSAEFLQQADRAGDELDKLRWAMMGLKSRIAVSLVPGLVWLVTKLQTGAAWLGRIAEKTNIVKVAMGAASAFGVGKLAKALVALGPETLLIIAAIAAVILIVEDLYTLFTGGESAIGDFIDAMFGVGASAAFVEQVRAVMAQLLDVALQLAPLFAVLGSLIVEAFKAALPVLVAIWKFFLGAMIVEVQALARAIQGVFEFLGKALSLAGPKLGAIGKLLGSEKLQEIGSTVSRVGGNVAGAASANPVAIGLPARAEAPAFIGPPLPPREQNVTQQNTTTIQINGAQNPQATGSAVRDSLSGLLNGASLRQALAAADSSGGE